MIVESGRPAAAVTAHAIRQVRRGALVVTAVAAGMSAMVAVTYDSTVGDPSNAAALSALAGNPAIRTLFGVPVALDDAGGFTVWRTGTVIAVLVGVWASLTATRLTRGEEDAGRWDLLLAGRVSLATVVVRHVAVLAAALAVTGLTMAAALLAAGTAVTGALLHGTGIALIGVFFVAVGALAAQVLPVRAAASGTAIAVLGAGLLLRMIADGVGSLAWTRWLTPFGMLEATGAYDVDRWWPLLLLAGSAAMLLAAVPVVAAHRDLRDGRLAVLPARAPWPGLLGSPSAFAGRRLLGPIAGWSAGLSAYCLLIGLISASMTGFLTANPRFAQLAGEAGFEGLDTVQGYVATLFGLLAVPIGAFTAVRIAAFAAAESDRRLILLYAQPITRWRLLGAEAAVTAGGAVLLVTVAGLATWAGTVGAGADLSAARALAGTLNLLPVVLLSLGAAVLALGVAPRAVTAIGVLPSAGGFLLLVIADSVGAPAWVSRLSPYGHLGLVPYEAPDWSGTAGMLLTATILAVSGGYAYHRRDLAA